MSEATATTTPTVPQVPAPEPEKHPDGAPILKGAAATAFWPNEAKAVEIAKGRTKGARFAFTVKTSDGKIRYATATHAHFLMEFLLEEMKVVVTQVGKPERSSSPPSVASVLASADLLPEAEREAIKKQLLEWAAKQAKK